MDTRNNQDLRMTILISSSSNFPREIVEEIMSYLPPKSLIRFKCVSKSWYDLINALIKNPEFVIKHLHNSNNTPFSQAACFIFKNINPYKDHDMEVHSLDDCNIEERFYMLSILNDYSNDSHALHLVTEHINLHELIIQAEGKDLDLSYVIAHHCNGIICLSYFDSFILYNPAIKESKFLLKPQLGNYNNPWYEVEIMGFGYDSRANDYKILICTCVEFVYVAMLYSSSTNSWKEIKIPLKANHSHIPHKEIYLKGVCYWLMEDQSRSEEDPNDIIVSFEMCDEEFSINPLPEVLQTPNENCTSLTVWNESVALFFFPGGGPLQSIEIWVMVNRLVDNVGGSCSFVKELTIGPLVGIGCPLAFWKSDELLMKGTKKGELVSYNLYTKKLRKLKVNGVNRISSWVLFYVKSVASVQAKEQTSCQEC